MKEPDESDEMPSDPNGSAYQKAEKRTGPPLDYVAEKLESSLVMIHNTIRSIREMVPEDLPQSSAAIGSSYSVKQDGLVSPAWSAFRYGLTAFLALQNMLALANDPKIFERLLGYTTEQFRDWLNNIDRRGLISE